MTNFSHWAYWTMNKETCSSLRHSMILKSRKIKFSIFGQRVLMWRKLWWKGMSRKSEASLLISQGFRLRRTSSVLCLSREHILISLHHFPPQWQKSSQANYLHIKGWVRMAPVPLFLMLFCEKCNAEMINCREDPVLFLIVIRLNQNAQV